MPYRRRKKPTADRPTADLGFHVRTLRKAAGVTHEDLSERTGIRAPQFSILETGHNVESKQYTIIAKALGFKTALEMFQTTDPDPLERHWRRAWSMLSDDQRRRAVKFLNTEKKYSIFARGPDKWLMNGMRTLNDDEVVRRAQNHGWTP